MQRPPTVRRRTVPTRLVSTFRMILRCREMKPTKTISYLSQVWGRVGKEMKSEEEENEDEETNGASNSGHIGVR